MQLLTLILAEATHSFCVENKSINLAYFSPEANHAIFVFSLFFPLVVSCRDTFSFILVVVSDNGFGAKKKHFETIIALHIHEYMVL